jgi:CRP-like cAMP-binding protein
VQLSEGLVSELPETLLAPLFREGRLRHLKAGERLFATGDVGDGCYWLDKGAVKVEVASVSGEERIIAILGSGAIVGELSVIDGLPRSASVVALRDCVLRFVSRRTFADFVKVHPENSQVLLAILARRLRKVDEVLAVTTCMSVKARVARALLELAAHVGQPSGKGQIEFRERISQGDLAAMAGVARENVSRALSEFRRRNIVAGSGRDLCLKNVAALEREVTSEVDNCPSLQQIA